MNRVIRIRGKRVQLPVFAATVFLNKDSWFWTRGVPAEALLVSYDVLAARSGMSERRLDHSFDFPGLTICDSGAYGKDSGARAVEIYDVQRTLDADISVSLDRIIDPTAPRRVQRSQLEETVANASLLRQHRNVGRFRAEAAIQGGDTKQRRWCASRLAEEGFMIFGVPVSRFSRYRRYVGAAERVLEVRDLLPRGSVMHGMGAGSRTMIAVLSALGVELFDSTSWFTDATRGDTREPITYCVLGKPAGKPACELCQARPRKPQSTRGKAAFNLIEVLKEVVRTRCALEEGRMPEYLDVRVPAPTMKALRQMTDSV